MYTTYDKTSISLSCTQLSSMLLHMPNTHQNLTSTWYIIIISHYKSLYYKSWRIYGLDNTNIYLKKCFEHAQMEVRKLKTDVCLLNVSTPYNPLSTTLHMVICTRSYYHLNIPDWLFFYSAILHMLPYTRIMTNIEMKA